MARRSDSTRPLKIEPLGDGLLTFPLRASCHLGSDQDEELQILSSFYLVLTCTALRNAPNSVSASFDAVD